ncbi:MAG: acyl-CoA carboxylase subunit beta, partial [Planctomycetes bacterium]|nr:acyl-CoA carboxylase subunit beta [Planctomycetota bacterium]
LDADDSPGSGGPFLEFGLWAAYGMYPEWGAVPAAGVVTGIGYIHGRSCMIVANDATVKAGAFFPQTVKKVLRAQRIAAHCCLPLVYLVDSSGVFLPMQDEIFPDEDDFGRIFRNNAVLSAAGVPQIAAIMGDCIAGGAYLPVLCDKILMTKGSRLYLAGPALVKAAIGQVTDEEELGGADMHARISGTIDFCEPDDESCLRRLRSLIELLPAERYADDGAASRRQPASPPQRDPGQVCDVLGNGSGPYNVGELLACILDRDSMSLYKEGYGQTLLTAYARIGGHAVGVIANQHIQTQSAKQGLQIGGVIYADSADKAARFVMDCSQNGLPLVFFQDVQGFMVGRGAEQSGIIRSGAKLVSAVSNAGVAKLTVIIGGSFGAGNYALCGKAFDPVFIFAWPSAQYAVMGGAQAADTLLQLEERQARRQGRLLSPEDCERLRDEIENRYNRQMDVRYAAARGWVDAIIQPHQTREVLIRALSWASRPPPPGGFRAGILQV